MTIHRTTFFIAVAALSALSCQGDKDSYVVLHSDVNCDVPRVYQLSVIVSNPGTAQDQKTVPNVASGELGFPNTIVLVLPSSRSGAISLEVEALDNKFTEVGYGAVSGEIDVGGQIDLYAQLAAVSNPPTSSGTVDGGASGNPDAGSTSRPDLAASSGLPFVQVAVGK